MTPTALQTFLRLESAGGLVLMGITALALIVANSPLAGFYGVVLNIPLAVSIGDFAIANPLLLWINDGLMAVFFFLVGLELKREVIEGHLSSLRMASLPAAAAVGGMAAPAAIYAWLNWTDPVALNGWSVSAQSSIDHQTGGLPPHRHSAVGRAPEVRRARDAGRCGGGDGDTDDRGA